jgi:hypothetical protein
MNRKTFLLTTPEQLKTYLSEVKSSKDGNEYLRKVCKVLDDIRPGQIWEIDRHVKQENLEKFIKSVCLYIDAWPSMKIEFTNDLTGIKKRV